MLSRVIGRIVIAMRFRTLDQLLKLRYSLFDAPAILAGALLPFADRTFAENFVWGQWQLWLAIVLAMTFARSAGMAFNEYIDRRIDALNPRTAQRAIPTGRAKASHVLALALIATALFLITSCCINRTAALWAPILAAMVALYSYLKRVTPLCHFFLGVVIASGPIGAAVAIADRVPASVLCLALALLTSITANDIIYGSQDYDFDRGQGVYSLPARVGIRGAFAIASMLHFVTGLALVLIGYTASLGPLFYAFTAGIKLYLVRHHWRIRRGANLQQAFLWCNKVVAIGAFLAVLGGLLWRG